MTPSARRAAILALALAAGGPAACTDAHPPRPEGRRPAAEAPAPEPVAGALARAAAEGKRVVLDFHADGCGPCRSMEESSWPDARVRKALDGFVFRDVDVDAHGDAAARYGVRAIPTVIVLGPGGEVLARATGFRDAAGLASFLEGAPEAGK